MITFEILISVIVVSFLAGFIGVILIIHGKKWDEQKFHWGLGFSAGLLIGISLLEIIPTAISLTESKNIMVFALIGFLTFFILEKFILLHHFDRHEKKNMEISLITFIALSIHAFLDGIIIGLGLEFSEKFGIILFVAIIFHKLPLSISVGSLLLTNIKRKKAVIKMLIFSFMTPIGLIIASNVLTGIQQDNVAILLALSAGILIYLGATDMLPEITHHTHQETEHASLKKAEINSTIWVILGFSISLIPNLLL